MDMLLLNLSGNIIPHFRVFGAKKEIILLKYEIFGIIQPTRFCTGLELSEIVNLRGI